MTPGEKISTLLKQLDAQGKRQLARDAGTSLSYLYRLTGAENPNPTAKIVAALTRFSRGRIDPPITAEDFV